MIYFFFPKKSKGEKALNSLVVDLVHPNIFAFVFCDMLELLTGKKNY
jgi:hypothetical protein